MNYVPISTVLYDLSLTIDPSSWNESNMLEFAIQASRKIGGARSFAQRQEFYEYKNYILEKPDDLKTLTQIFYFQPSRTSSPAQAATMLEYVKRVTDHPHPTSLTSEINNPDLAAPWAVVRKSVSSFISPCRRTDNRCALEYLEENDHFKLPLKSGIVSMTYLAYNKKDGEFLIPDIQVYKEAIAMFCMYRIYDAKVNADTKDQFLQQQRAWYLQRFGFLFTKARAEVNAPDVADMENLLQNRNKLISRSDQFANGFVSLNKPQGNPKLF
jgi:hypothetical protein